MPRGDRNFYNPIVQVPDKVEGEKDLSRIELFPEGAPEDPNPKWRGRLINPDGSIAEVASGDFDHDRALAQAQMKWAGLTVYELRSEGEDSTWEGHGPSPRLWQISSPETGRGRPPVEEPASSGPPTDREASVAGDETIPPAVSLRVMPVTQPGNYALLDDICSLLELWAVQYEMDKNPSGALALREAVDALKEIG